MVWEKGDKTRKRDGRKDGTGRKDDAAKNKRKDPPPVK